MYKAKISYGSMTDEEIFFSDYKEYEVNKTKFSVGVVNAYDEADAEDLVHRMKAVMPKAIPIILQSITMVSMENKTPTKTA